MLTFFLLTLIYNTESGQLDNHRFWTFSINQHSWVEGVTLMRLARQTRWHANARGSRASSVGRSGFVIVAIAWGTTGWNRRARLVASSVCLWWRANVWWFRSDRGWHLCNWRRRRRSLLKEEKKLIYLSRFQNIIHTSCGLHKKFCAPLLPHTFKIKLGPQVLSTVV